MTLVLVDEPVVLDYRVKSNYSGKNTVYVNCKNFRTLKTNIKDWFSFFLICIKNYYFFINIFQKNIYFNGLFKGLKKTIKIYSYTKTIRNEILKTQEFDSVAGNDLFCGLLGKELKDKTGKYFIYDAHEVEFNRNREKNGLLRVFADMCLECEIIKKVDEIRVVNKPIKKLYEEIYGIDSSKIKVVNNSHFECCYDFYKKNFKFSQTAILYIGEGTRGRLLEDLAEGSKKYNIPVYAFFLNTIPDYIQNSGWYLGNKNYLSEVKDLIKTKTLLMWCVNDLSCLSYRLALPNKFFQAVALGMPVIVYKGTYLEEIVTEYKIGYVYNNDFEKIMNQLKDKNTFLKTVENMNNFQKLIYSKKFIL